MMQIYITTLISVLLSVLRMEAQVCTGEYTFTTQAEVDQFLIDNPTCADIDGTVYISSYLIYGDPIVNLDAFANITHINTLWIEKEEGIVLSLAALSNVTQIDETFFYGLYDFTGLENMVYCGLLDINYQNLNNGPNIDLTPFDDLASVDALYLTIDDETASLYNIFPNLTTVTSIYLPYNMEYYTRVAAMTGFDQVTSLEHFEIGSYYDINTRIDDCSLLNNATDIYYLGIGGLHCVSYNCFNSLVTTFILDIWIPGQVVDFPNLVNATNLNFWAGHNLPTTYNINSLTSCESLGVAGDMGPETFTLSMTSLEEVNVDLAFVSSNTDFALVNIQLPSLINIGGDLRVDGCHYTNLDFLSGIIAVDGEISIRYCPLLTSCSIQALCDKLESAPELVTIEFNAPGCDNLEEAGNGCQLNFVAGTVFADIDCDGIFNNNDVAINHPIMLDDTFTPIGTSNENGLYYIPLANNVSYEFGVSAQPGLLPVSSQSVVTDGTNQGYTGYDFAVCPDPVFHDLQVTAVSFPLKRGFNHIYHLSVKNLGGHLEQAIVSFDFSNMPGAQFVSSNPNSTINGSIVTFESIDLSYLEVAHLHVTFFIDAAVPLGTQYNPVVSVEMLNNMDVNPLNDTYSSTQTVVGSYDPNDISVNIQALNYEDFPQEGLTLDYLIRFQNTGTAPAEFVRVTDIIEEDLNLGSIEMLDASHPYQLTFNENREVEWLFENIQLPDSTSDMEGSQGYIHYRIKTNPDVTIDDVIENTAAIYFDYNEPVITNTATTVFYECPDELVIIGESQACEGSSIDLDITYGWDDYNWAMNDNVLDESEVDLTIYNLEPGMHLVTCTALSNNCQSYADFLLEVFERPDSIQITGDQEICEGESVAFTATSEWSDYIWNQMGVGTISTTDQAEVLFPDIGQHVIQVQTTNEICWTYTEVTFTVFANPEAEIQYNGQFISGPSQYTYTWYINGELIEGLTSYSIDPWLYAVDGFTAYAVVTGTNDCTATTNTVSSVGVSETSEDFIEVYPNPMQNETFVKLPSGNFTIELFNAIGQRIETWSNVQSSHVVHRNQLTSGAYMLKMTNEIGMVFTTTLYVR